jgi:hypothetical protein
MSPLRGRLSRRRLHPIHVSRNAPAGPGGRQMLLAGIKNEQRLSYLSPQSRSVPIDSLNWEERDRGHRYHWSKRLHHTVEALAIGLWG